MKLDKTSVNIVIDRDWLEGKVVQEDDPMDSIKKTARETTPGKLNHNILFHGYDDDPREVKDIHECRVFCERIMRECPEFINVATELTMGVLLYGTDIRLFNGHSEINPAWQAVWSKEHIAALRLTPWRLN